MAAAVAAAGVALVARRLKGRLRHPIGEAVRLVATGTASSVVTNSSGLARAWGPALATVALAAPKRPIRVAAAAALALPALADWSRLDARIAVTRYVLTHVADDVVYGCGVLVGCVRARNVGPLVPEIVLGRRTWPARSQPHEPEPRASGHS